MGWWASEQNVAVECVIGGDWMGNLDRLLWLLEHLRCLKERVRCGNHKTASDGSLCREVEQFSCVFISTSAYHSHSQMGEFQRSSYNRMCKMVFSGENDFLHSSQALTLRNLSWHVSFGVVLRIGPFQIFRWWWSAEKKNPFSIPSGFPSLQATFSPVLLSTENDKGEWSLATS